MSDELHFKEDGGCSAIMTVFTCKSDFESMLTCIYTAWASKLGHENLRLEVEPLEQLNLFEEYIHVEADPAKASSVATAVCTRISVDFYDTVTYSLGACERDTLDTVYRMLILGFAYGDKALDMYGYKAVVRFHEISRRYSNEAHSFLEFLRFHEPQKGVYVAHIEPHSHVVLSIAGYFADRMPSEHWMIIDDVHFEAAVHPAGESYYIMYLTQQEMERLLLTEHSNDGYTALWKAYFDSIAIKQKINYRCQMNHFPKWKRKHAVEFM